MYHPLSQGAQAIGSPNPHWGMDYGQRSGELLDDEGVGRYNGPSRHIGRAQHGGPGPQGGQSTARSLVLARDADVIRVSKGIYGTAYKLMDVYSKVSIPPVVTPSEVASRLLSEGSHEVHIYVNSATYEHYQMPLASMEWGRVTDAAASVAAGQRLLQDIASVAAGPRLLQDIASVAAGPSLLQDIASVAAGPRLLQHIASVVYHNRHKLVPPYGRTWVELAVEGIYAHPRDLQRPQAQTWIVVLHWE